MSTRTKWLLICLLAVLSHALYMTAIGASMYGGELMFALPVGVVDRPHALTIAFIEAHAVFVLVIAFAISTLRDQS